MSGIELGPIHHLRLTVTDIERSRAFYTQLLGFQVAAESPPADDPSAAAVYPVLWGGIVMGIYTVGLTIIGERFKGSELVGANAAYVILYSLGLLLGPSVQGVALDAWNPHGLLVALGGICALYVLFLMRPRAVEL